MTSIQPLPAAQTLPHGPDARGRPSSPRAAATEPTDGTVGDKIDLSPAARRLTGAEKSNQSTANRARAILEASPQLAEQPFGRIVSQVARGLLSLEDVIAKAPEDGEDATQVDGGEETSPTQTATSSIGDAQALIGDLIEELTEGLVEDDEPVDLIA